MTKTPENSMATKHLWKQNEFVKIQKEQLLIKNKLEKIHKEPGQSHLRLSSTTVTVTKGLDQSDCQFSCTTVTDTTIEESKNKIYVAFKNIFSDFKIEQIHNDYFCQQRNCRHNSSEDLAAMSKDNNFQHKWLFDPKYAYCEKTKTCRV